MKKKVLVVEDNDQNRYLVRFILEDQGFDVHEVETGAKALEAVKDVNPDLILLDIQLPDMDGYEIAAALREGGHVDETPIIAVTSYAMPGDREKVLDAGCTGYIEKPIEPSAFAAEVARTLGDNGSIEGEV